MLRRPLSTVLSSLSSRSLPSIRLCSAPLTSTDDQITTVRTTGMYWMQDGYSRTLRGVYWGEGDPRSAVDGNTRDAPNLPGAMLQSIVMALEQAKKDGIKKIRVQTDFKISGDDYRNVFQSRMENSHMSRNPNCVFYEKIIRYMDKMEVFIEHRSSLNEKTNGNDVIHLLMEERQKQHPDYIPYNFTASDWTITPKDSLPLEGRTVPTVYAVGRLQDGFDEGTYASLWLPESIDHLEIKPKSLKSCYHPSKMYLTLPQAQFVAIIAAIEEAQSLSIPEIQVVTDSIHFVEFFKKHWISPDGEYLTNSEFYLQIKALTETTKVHFKGVKLTDDCNDKWLLKVREMANDERLLSPPPTSADDQITTVRTTGQQWMANGIGRTRKGVYWGEGDPRNILKGRNADGTDLCGTRLRAIVMALEQARKDGLKKIRVQTDFKMKEPDYREEMLRLKQNNFMMVDGNTMPNAEAYQRVLNCMDEMEVIIEYRTPWLTNGNEVMRLLSEGFQKQFPRGIRNNSDLLITPKDALPLEGRTVPTVYAVAGLLDGWGMEDYATLWMPESIDHLEIEPRSLGSSVRPSGIPLSIFQASLVAIHDAINEARCLNIPEILVITNSTHFIRFFKSDWNAYDGRLLPNATLYNEIKTLTETTKVHFKGVKLNEDDDEELLAKLNEMAKGLEKQSNNALLNRLDSEPFWNKKPQPTIV